MQPEQPKLEDIKIPRLNPSLRLFRAESDKSGHPRWRLYHALSNTYFDIGWMEYEALSRFSQCDNALELKNTIEAETSLNLEDEDVIALITFLNRNGLLSSTDAFSEDFKPAKDVPLWKRIVHNYLFFSVPLFKPQSFLKKTWPTVRPLFSKSFFSFSMLVLLIFSVLTLGKIDEFANTFFMFLSMEGAITIFVVFFFIKILHEFGHAYTAHKYSVDVPHMGIAFMVMYPVLYTETTGAWRLDSKDNRIAIGLAGIKTELMLAAYALVLWNILPAGMLQSIAFSIVTISLLGSLLVNLNPLMRFDGYFIFSDYLGIENLHARGFKAVRWSMRKFLFGLREEPPEDDKKRLGFLIYFGAAVLIYRFFLFLGIALLVYYLFFKPLGLIMMLIELGWFIALPIWSEIKIWIEKRHEIIAQSRAKVTLSLVGIGIVLLFLPTSNTLVIPAVAHSQEYRAIYPPVPAKVGQIMVQDNQSVQQGDVLVRLTAPALEKDISLAEIELNALKDEKRQLQSNIEMAKERLLAVEIEIKSLQQKLGRLQKQQDDLIVRAEFSGIIRDSNPNISEGQFVSENTLILRLLSSENSIISAYVSESDLDRIEKGNKATFRPHHQFLSEHEYSVFSIDEVSTKKMDWPELSSIYGGSIASEFSNDALSTQSIVPRQSLYKVKLKGLDDRAKDVLVAQRGAIYISGKPSIPALKMTRFISESFMREINLN